MPQLKHIVMWNVVGESAEERSASIEVIRAAFEGLIGFIPGLLTLEIGADVSRAEHACDVVLVSVFDSAQSLADYAAHPAHGAVKTRLANIRTARYQVDYVA